MPKKELLAELHLPYHKQGDDLNYYLTELKLPPVKAMVAHAKMLEGAARLLRRVALELEGHEVKVEAGTHTIWVAGPESLINRLLKRKLLDPDLSFDKEEER